MEKMNQLYGHTFDLLTMDSKYKSEVSTAALENVYFYNSDESFVRVVNALPKYPVIEIHYLEEFYSQYMELFSEKYERLHICIWGSDFYRSSAEDRETKEKVIQLADKIIFGNPKTQNDFISYYNIQRKKTDISQFGLSVLDEIDNISELRKEELMSKFGISRGKVVVTIGHNASPAQRHEEIILNLEEHKLIKDKCYFILPMTYGKSDAYLSKIKKILKKHQFQYIILEEFMADEQVAALRSITDIFIQLQPTDQLSGSMQEHLYAGSVVITGSWLPYEILKNEGIYFLEVNRLTQVGEKLIQCVSDLDKHREFAITNNIAIKKLSHWNIVGEKWNSRYITDINAETESNSPILLKFNIKRIIDAGKIDIAKQLIEEYLKIYESDSEILSMKGLVHFIENEYQKARECFKNGLLIKPYNFDLLYNLGYLYEVVGEGELAYLYYLLAKSNSRSQLEYKEVSECLERICFVVQRLPLVSIGIISYNSETYIRECLESVLNQSYGNIEVMIGDDCSKDGTADILGEYALLHNNIRYFVHRENTGCQTRAIQRLINDTNGNYLMIISFDDLLAGKNTIVEFTIELLENPKLDFVFSEMNIINENSVCVDKWSTSIFSQEDIIRHIFNTGSGIIPMGMGIFKKSFLESLPEGPYLMPSPFDPKGNTGADTLNTLYYLKNNMNYYKIDKAIMCYRIHEDNLSHSLESRIKSNFYVQKYICENFDIHIIFPGTEWTYVSNFEEYAYFLLAKHFYLYAYNYINQLNIPEYIKYKVDRESLKESSALYIDQALIYLDMAHRRGRLYHNERRELTRLIELDFETKSKYDHTKLLKIEYKVRISDIKRAACISFYGRSGSVFVQSLLDNHPSIIMLPGLYLMDYGEFWNCIASEDGIDNVYIKLKTKYGYLFDSNIRYRAPVSAPWEDLAYYCRYDEMGDDQSEILTMNETIFKNEFYRCLHEEGLISRKNVFLAVQIAYFYAIGREYIEGTDLVVMYSMHSSLVTECHHLWFLEDFPSAKIIYTLREPLANIGSIIQYQKKFELFNLDSPTMILLSMGISTGPQVLYGRYDLNNIVALKLEDVHGNPVETLTRVCKFLDIAWSETMLQSTFNGLKWWNFRDTIKLNGFTTEINNRKYDDLYSNFDRFRLEALLEHVYQAWNYPLDFEISHEDLRLLMKYPFKFEKFYQIQTREIRKTRSDNFNQIVDEIITKGGELKKWMEQIKLIGGDGNGK